MMNKTEPDVWQSLLSSTEFWSAVVGALAGAITGGLIAYLIQRQALREARSQRQLDRRSTQQALGYSLLFKVVRILSNIHAIHRHIEGCFEEAEGKKLGGEPWSFVQPLANLPEPVHFSPDEMGMLFAQKDDTTFNAVVEMDVLHNSLIEIVKVLGSERRALAERLRPTLAEGNIVTGVLDENEALALRPRMIEVNSLVEGARTAARNDLVAAKAAMDNLSRVLRDKLGIAHKLELNVELPKG